MAKVKFVKYECEPLSRCRGALYVWIDNKLISFGAWCDCKRSQPDYPPFWESGGEVDYDDNGMIKDCRQGPWKLAKDISKWDYTEEIERAFPELIRIMNENVRWGCCGGCIFKPVEI